MEEDSKQWEQYFRNDASNMLEDALPYLPDTVKKAAAVYIKIQELLHISNEFDDEETMSACGLNQNSTSMEMILNALKLRAPQNAAEQIDQILTMMEMAKLYQGYQQFLKSNPELAGQSSSSENDPLAKMMPILMSQKKGAPNGGNQELFNQLNQILKQS